MEKQKIRLSFDPDQRSNRAGLPFRRRTETKPATIHDIQKRIVTRKQTRSPSSALPISRRISPRVRSLAIIGFAIVLGIFLGVVILSMFADFAAYEATDSTYIANNGITDGAADSIDAADTSHHAPQLIPSGSVEDGKLFIPERTYYVVQAGAFSDKETGNTLMHQFWDNEISARLFDYEEPYRLYVSISYEMDTSQQLGTYFEEQGIDVYVRDHSLPAVTTIELDVDEETVAYLPSLISKADQLLHGIGKLSADGLASAGTRWNDDEWHELNNVYRQFLEDARNLQDAIDSNEHISAVGDMVHEMTNAMNMMDRYEDHHHLHYLLQVQQCLLEYVHVFERWIMEIQA